MFIDGWVFFYSFIVFMIAMSSIVDQLKITFAYRLLKIRG